MSEKTQHSQPEIEGLIERLRTQLSACQLALAEAWKAIGVDALGLGRAHLFRPDGVDPAHYEALLRSAGRENDALLRAEAAEARLSALLSLKEGGGLGSSSAESGALLASQASCSATPSSTGKDRP